MLLVIALLIMMGLAFGPSFWVRTVMRRHAVDRPDYPGTGGEFARHLLDENGLQAVAVEVTPHGDHYDPREKVVRLSQENHAGRSVTAVAVAAHEVGHALQDRDGFRPLRLSGWLVSTANLTDRIGSVLILVLSAIFGATLSPRLFILGIAAVIGLGLVRVVAHLAMLPVEIDASFKRAFPIIDQGRYLPKEDLPGVRSVLRAAACTYVAASLMQVLNLLRILRAFR